MVRHSTLNGREARRPAPQPRRTAEQIIAEMQQRIEQLENERIQ